MFEEVDKKKFAELAGMSPQQLSMSLNKKVVVGYKVACRLEKAGKKLGLELTFQDYMTGSN